MYLSLTFTLKSFDSRVLTSSVRPSEAVVPRHVPMSIPDSFLPWTSSMHRTPFSSRISLMLLRKSVWADSTLLRSTTSLLVFPMTAYELARRDASSTICPVLTSPLPPPA